MELTLVTAAPMVLCFGFVTKSVGNRTVFWPLLISACTASRASPFPQSAPSSAMWLGWARCWECKRPGQPTLSHQRDMTSHITLWSAVNLRGVCLFLDDHYSKTALFVAGLAFPFAPAPSPPPFLCLLNCIYLNSGFFFFFFAFALIAQERGVS